MNREPPGLPPSLRPALTDDWRPKVRKATDLVVAFVSQLRGGDPETVREGVIAAAREAVGDGSVARTTSVDLGGGRGVRPAEMMNSAGVFRLVLHETGRGQRTPPAAETFVCEIQRRLDEVLSDADLLARIRSGGRY